MLKNSNTCFSKSNLNHNGNLYPVYDKEIIVQLKFYFQPWAKNLELLQMQYVNDLKLQVFITNFARDVIENVIK